MALRYEIRLRGRVGAHLAAALGLEAEAEPEPERSVLTGPLTPLELQRALTRLEERGVEVVELRRLPDR
jgi:hypothetical protein